MVTYHHSHHFLDLWRAWKKLEICQWQTQCDGSFFHSHLHFLVGLSSIQNGDAYSNAGEEKEHIHKTK